MTNVTCLSKEGEGKKKACLGSGCKKGKTQQKTIRPVAEESGRFRRFERREKRKKKKVSSWKERLRRGKKKTLTFQLITKKKREEVGLKRKKKKPRTHLH